MSRMSMHTLSCKGMELLVQIKVIQKSRIYYLLIIPFLKTVKDFHKEDKI